MKLVAQWDRELLAWLKQWSYLELSGLWFLALCAFVILFPIMSAVASVVLGAEFLLYGPVIIKTAIGVFFACCAVKWWASRGVPTPHGTAEPASDVDHDDFGPIGWLRDWSYLDLCGGAFMVAFATFVTFPIFHMVSVALFDFGLIEHAVRIVQMEVLLFVTLTGTKWGIARRDAAARRRARSVAA